jgi:DNA polymerase
MTNPLADINNICFVDFETRALPGTSASDGNVKTAGTYRYVQNSGAIISTWAIGNGPVFDVSLSDFTWGYPMKWSDTPPELRAFYGRVANDEAWFAAFNAGFDRNVWNAIPSFPKLLPEHMIDVMAQVLASNLPPSLEGAARALRLAGKQSDGKELIKLFCSADGATPQSHPAEWEQFKAYGRQDTALMREVWERTRALPFEEWEDYWVSERVNERGVAVDLPFIERAAAIAALDKERSNELLTRWTNGQITKVTEIQKITAWAYDALEFSTPREIMTKTWDEDSSPEDGEDRKPAKLGLDRGRIEKLLAYYDDLNQREGLTDREQLLVDVLTIRQFGGGAAPAKFQKMLDQHDGGRLKGQYVFNGAQQTGRFSSKGVQTHNLTRASLKSGEVPAIEMINEAEL